MRECDDCPTRKNIIYDGPIVEIVINEDTASFDAPIVDGKVQQTLQPGTLDGIGLQALVQAWVSIKEIG